MSQITLHHDKLFNDLIKRISSEYKVDFSGYKSDFILNRIEDRLQAHNITNFSDYLKIVENDDLEYRALAGLLTIHVTRFFRNSYTFDLFKNEYAPEIAGKGGPIRIWSAGCSTGEEPYTMGIIFTELFRERGVSLPYKIFATDIDPAAIENAKAGIFSRSALIEARLEIVDRYFELINGMYHLIPDIRPLVSFSLHDVASPVNPAPSDSVYGDFDVALCRNVLIYFNDNLQALALHNIHKSLKKGGIVILGQSEAMPPDFEKKFTAENERLRIYRKR